MSSWQESVKAFNCKARATSQPSEVTFYLSAANKADIASNDRIMKLLPVENYSFKRKIVP